MKDIRQKIVDAAGLAEWRRGLPSGAGGLAVVVGSFDVIQPGMLYALRKAGAAAGTVLAVVPGGNPAGADSDARPWEPLGNRIETLTHLRSVSAVCAVEPDGAGSAFSSLSPFTLVTCSAAVNESMVAGAMKAASVTTDLPILRGCRTDDIIAAIRKDRTPVRIPPDYPKRNAVVRRGAADDVRRVTVNGCFDVLHIGHLRFLAQARNLGDELVVLINSDDSVRRYKGKDRPVFSLDFRLQALLELESVGQVLPFEQDKPLELIGQVRPKVHAKGGTYETDRVRQEQELVEGWGGRIEYCEMVDGYSTSRWIRMAEERGRKPENGGA